VGKSGILWGFYRIPAALTQGEGIVSRDQPDQFGYKRAFGFACQVS
jgi:hypothetical protein